VLILAVSSSSHSKKKSKITLDNLKRFILNAGKIQISKLAMKRKAGNIAFVLHRKRLPANCCCQVKVEEIIVSVLTEITECVSKSRKSFNQALRMKKWCKDHVRWQVNDTARKYKLVLLTLYWGPWLALPVSAKLAG
jgi:hypothetical protein